MQGEYRGFAWIRQPGLLSIYRGALCLCEPGHQTLKESSRMAPFGHHSHHPIITNKLCQLQSQLQCFSIRLMDVSNAGFCSFRQV